MAKRLAIQYDAIVYFVLYVTKEVIRLLDVTR